MLPTLNLPLHAKIEIGGEELLSHAHNKKVVGLKHKFVNASVDYPTLRLAIIYIHDPKQRLDLLQSLVFSFSVLYTYTYTMR